MSLVLAGVLLSACAEPSPATIPALPPPAEPAPAVVPAEPAPELLPSSGPFRRELAPGLVVAAYEPPSIPDEGFSKPDPATLGQTDRRFFVVTIDPNHYEIVYLSSVDPSTGTGPLRADQWVDKFDLHVAFNPGMFEPEGAATGHTRAGSFVSQPAVRRHSLYRAWFVADPLAPGLPAVATLDQLPPKGKGPQGKPSELPAAFQEKLAGYFLVSQSLAILREGKAAYPPRDKQWSELAYGTDREGRVVVVFSRFPYEMREFGRRVEALQLGIEGLLHGEGGPEASLVVRAGGATLVKFGSYETGFADDSNEVLWTLPSVMGARPRKG